MPNQPTPVAYFVTFATHGSHLPGEPGTVNRHQNGYGEARPAMNNGLAASAWGLMSQREVVLNHAMRVAAESAMRQHCTFRGWTLHALNIRTNHVHAVVSAQEVPAAAVAGQLKAWATRFLREQRLAGPNTRIWARHSSTKMVWTEQDLVEAVDYVLFRQGTPLT